MDLWTSLTEGSHSDGASQRWRITAQCAALYFEKHPRAHPQSQPLLNLSFVLNMLAQNEIKISHGLTCTHLAVGDCGSLAFTVLIKTGAGQKEKLHSVHV